MAAVLLDVRAHDVHADTATAHVGDLLGGRETRGEDQQHRVAIAERPCLLGRDDPLLHRLGPQLLGVDARTVVPDLDLHVAALLEGRQGKRPLGRLAGRLPSLRSFDPVIDGVAHEVGQWIPEGLEDRPVELDLLAFDDESASLAELRSQVAHHARQLLEDVADRLQPRLHDRLLHLAHDLAQVGGGLMQSRLVGGTKHLQHLVATEHHLAGQGHQAIQKGNADPDRVRPLRFGRVGHHLLAGGPSFFVVPPRLERRSRLHGATGVRSGSRPRRRGRNGYLAR